MTHNPVAKETVVVVHGTWAAPLASQGCWYDLREGTFATQLNAALEKHGHPARCWAHCAETEEIFAWAGENNWLARTTAAEHLTKYVSKLRDGGWKCHVIAHSHGGNIVLEALPYLLQGEGGKDHQEADGSYVFLGTPFVDTISPFSQLQERRRKRFAIASWILSFAIAALFVFLMIIGTKGSDSNWIGMLIIGGPLLLTPLVLLLRGRRARSWSGLISDISNGKRAGPRILVMNSDHDEARQALHHLRVTENPLAPSTGLLRHVWTTLRELVAQRKALSRIRGIVSFADAIFMTKLFVCAFYITGVLGWGSVIVEREYGRTIFRTAGLDLTEDAFNTAAGWMIVGWMFVFSIGAAVTRGAMLSALASPFRWVWNGLAVMAFIPSEVATYFVRRRMWSVLQRLALGLMAYPYPLPQVDRVPSVLPKAFFTYEDLPPSTVERVLAQRNEGIGGRFGTVSNLLAKTTITSADLSSFLEEVERDLTLVHAAYYADDECINRIARWIADRA